MSESINRTKKRRWATFLKRLIVGLAIIVALSVIAAKTFSDLPPTTIRTGSGRLLGQHSSDSQIDLNFSGPVVLNQVTLLDHTRQRWIYIDKIRLIFPIGANLHPVLTISSKSTNPIFNFIKSTENSSTPEKPLLDSGNLLAPTSIFAILPFGTFQFPPSTRMV